MPPMPASPYPTREASASMKRSGFTHIGTYPEVGFKHGQWHSVGYWRKTLCAVEPPIEIIPFSEIKGE